MPEKGIRYFYLNVSKDLGLTGGADGGARSVEMFLVLFTYHLTTTVSGTSRSRAFGRVLSPLPQASKGPYRL